MVLHVSLSHIVPSTLASAAFQLAFFGAFEDYRTGKVSCTSNSDHVFVEVPNNLPLKQNFAFCRLLPGFDRILDVSAREFNIDARPSLAVAEDSDCSKCCAVTFVEAPYLDDGGCL